MRIACRRRSRWRKRFCATNPREMPRNGFSAIFGAIGLSEGWGQDIEQLANALQAFASLQDEDPANGS